MNKNLIIILVVIVTIVLIFAPIILRKVIWKKMVSALDHNNFNALYEIIDSKACAFAYPPFNREYMRLSGYLAQGDDKKIEQQLNYLKNLDDEEKVEGRVIISNVQTKGRGRRGRGDLR